MLYLFQVYALVITIAAVPLVALYVTAAAYQTVSVKLAQIERRQLARYDELFRCWWSFRCLPSLLEMPRRLGRWNGSPQ